MILLLVFSLVLVGYLRITEGQRAIKFPEAAELFAELETAYCSDKKDSTPCNEPMGRICINRQCVSLCSTGRYSDCSCAEGNCGLCCRSGNQVCTLSEVLGLSDEKGKAWFRQSSAESCNRPQSLGYGPVCPLHENGKVCDMFLKPGSSVEEPYLCRKGSCERPKCNMIQNSTLVDCGCRDQYVNYPFCCRKSNNITCLPYQWWLREFASLYLSSIGSSIVEQYWNLCSARSAQNKRCGPRHICRAFKCEHVCGEMGIGECICPPGTKDECHSCCMRSGSCVSININPNDDSFYRPIGTPCNFTYGVCDAKGACSKLDSHPTGSFCKDRGMEDCVCAPGSATECHICCIRAGRCQSTNTDILSGLHYRPIGTPCNFTYGTCSSAGKCNKLARHPSDSYCLDKGLQECFCSPGSKDECHTCCIRDGVCQSMSSGISRVFRPAGTSCNFTYGICDIGGQCAKLGAHPSDSFCKRTENDGKQCDDKRICDRGTCTHVCRGPEYECQCAQGSPTECHVCCLNQLRTECSSIYVKKRQFFLLKSVGTLCNFTYGTCDPNGDCKKIPGTHPGDSFCQKPSNVGQQCGDFRQCSGGQCNHVCTATGRLCKCPAGSSTECHLCCLDSVGNCKSIYDGRNPFLIQEVGTSCNFTYGACDASGACKGLASHPGTTFCQKFENNGLECGSQQVCRNFKCQHVCGDPEKLCVCPATSSSECHLCCLSADGKCRSVYDQVSNILLRPPGTGCNFSYGVCDTRGRCSAVQQHPGFSLCQGPDTEGIVCGEAQQCFRGECRHICGSSQQSCVCAAGSWGECHVCCIQDGVCKSVYDGRSSNMLQALGSPCNYTFGVCDGTGRCERVKEHPALQQCDFFENEGNQCGPHHVCHDFKCRHICGSEDRACRCEPSSEDECHVCCLQAGICRSVYDQRRPYLMQQVGTSCDLNRGTCNQRGQCEALTTYCGNSANDGKRCGQKHICQAMACTHICGDEKDECICEGDTSDECHICCLVRSSQNETCQSVYTRERTYLVHPVGSPCNFTRGVCIGGGVCSSVPDHPFYFEEKGKGVQSLHLNIIFHQSLFLLMTTTLVKLCL